MHMQQYPMNKFHRQFRSELKATLILVSSFSVLGFSSEASACAACGCTLSRDWQSQGISTKPGFTADLSYDYLNQDQQRYGTSAASSSLIQSQYAAGQEVEAYTKTQTVTATLIYNADSWGASIMLPYVMRDHGTYGDITGGPLYSSFDSSSDRALGDMKIIGRYSGFTESRTSGVIGGIKLPTGKTNATFSSGAPLDAGLQMGSGSTDLILGGYTTGTVGTYGWVLHGTVQHAIATKSLNGADYRPGDTYSVNTGIRYAGYGAKISPMLQLNIIKRKADTDNNTGVNVPLDPVTGVPVSGGTLVYLAPGVSMRIGGGASVYGFVQLPVYQNVNSLQITPKYTLTLGVRKSFDE
jgi:hypothetical protein